MITSSINLAFKKCKKENRPALLTYTVAGDNNKRKSLEILNSISKHWIFAKLAFLITLQLLTEVKSKIALIDH